MTRHIHVARPSGALASLVRPNLFTTNLSNPVTLCVTAALHLRLRQSDTKKPPKGGFSVSGCGCSLGRTSLRSNSLFVWEKTRKICQLSHDRTNLIVWIPHNEWDPSDGWQALLFQKQGIGRGTHLNSGNPAIGNGADVWGAKHQRSAGNEFARPSGIKSVTSRSAV